MDEINTQKSLEQDLLWEFEVNASNAQLINKLIMPNNIKTVTTSIVEQLYNVTKSKYCYAGCLDSDTNSVSYVVHTFSDHHQENLRTRKIPMDTHWGTMGKVMEKQKTLLRNNAKEINDSWTSILGKDIVKR